MSLLALVLAAAGCAALAPSPQQAAQVFLPGACLPSAIDASGSVLFACGSAESEWSVDGGQLGTSQVGAAATLPGRARGFWAIRSTAAGRDLVSIDRDGTLLGSLQAYPLAGGALQEPLLLPDPRGGAVLLQVRGQAGAVGPSGGWQLVFERVTDALSVVDGPRTIDSGPSPAPAFQGRVSTDGSFVLTEGGWHFPPLRSNQLAARWFDPAGAPLTGWFAALDQSTFGHPVTVLGDGSVVVESRYRSARLAKAPQPAPGWLPPEEDSAWPKIFVLPDRIVVARVGAGNCAAALEVRSPAGELCGTQSVPWVPTSAGSCLGGNVLVGGDGSLAVGSWAQPGAQVWPRLFAPR